MSTSDWHPQGLEAYANSRYSYEDAELLAQLWSIPVSEAKQAIGHKIIHNIEHLLPAKVAPDPKVDAHPTDWDSKALDAFFNSSFTYDDAERLAQLWGQPDAYAGKKLIGAKILNGDEHLVHKLLKGPANTNPDEKFLDVFFKSDYTYDDAELLAQLWGLPSVYEAKKVIGAKIFHGIEGNLPGKLHRGGENKLNHDEKLYDAFFNSEYSYDDAELLAQLWNISLGEAKKTIGSKILNGIEDLLPAKVRPGDDNPTEK
jgi:hypothetical protein